MCCKFQEYPKLLAEVLYITKNGPCHWKVYQKVLIILCHILCMKCFENYNCDKWLSIKFLTYMLAKQGKLPSLIQKTRKMLKKTNHAHWIGCFLCFHRSQEVVNFQSILFQTKPKND
jgi:hypothetical protein